MREVFLILFLVFSVNSAAGDFCDELNKKSYKHEARVLPEGGVYVVADRGRTFL